MPHKPTDEDMAVDLAGLASLLSSMTVQYPLEETTRSPRWAVVRADETTIPAAIRRALWAEQRVRELEAELAAPKE